jgi:hypothetical protein
MLKKCEKAGIFFKGKKLAKDEIIEVNSVEDLGQYQGLFSDIIENIIIEEIKEKKAKKGGKL